MRKHAKIVRVSDKMQRGYSYALTAPVGRNFDPEFRPELTPKEMLALGVFCGKYLNDCRKEFPASWFTRARLSPSGRDCYLNHFGVSASQPLSVWRKNGWIHEDDPRGWFQWYCRYYMGRRMPEEDARQIKRWKAIRRHIAQIEQSPPDDDPWCRPGGGAGLSSVTYKCAWRICHELRKLMATADANRGSPLDWCDVAKAVSTRHRS